MLTVEGLVHFSRYKHELEAPPEIQTVKTPGYGRTQTWLHKKKNETNSWKWRKTLYELENAKIQSNLKGKHYAFD